jgi:hypothetical protein
MGKHDQTRASTEEKDPEVVTTAPHEPPKPAASPLVPPALLPESPPEPEPKKPDPVGLAPFKALLSGPIPPDKGVSVMRVIQAATLAIYATEQPDLLVEAMTPDEVRAWAGRFRQTNPRAWHAALTGNVIQFTQYTMQDPSATVGRYQRLTSELTTIAFAYRQAG